MIVDVVKDTQVFTALEEEWDDLFHTSPRATVYQSWAWLYSWWEAYGKNYELRLITLRSEDGLLVGLIPLMLERRWGFNRLLFVGTGPLGRTARSDYLDALVRRGWEANAYEAAVRALRQMDGWHVAELREISPTATTWSILRSWNGPRIDLQVDPCWVIETKPWDELVMTLTKSQRKAARRTLRRAEEDGVRCALVGTEDVERAARRLVALHREMRRGRTIAPEHLTARFESFIVTTARRMTDRGLGGISEFWRDGEVIISSFSVFANALSIPYIVGVNQEAVHRYEWSTLFIWDALNVARSRDCSYMSLLQGKLKYKHDWSKDVPYYRITLSRSPVLWSLYLTILRCYLAYRSLRSRVTDYVKSDASPEWVKNTVEWLRKRGA
jgi:CelD/BcsL family acetyltransferase involved in cellulose biosynthesis